MLADQVMRDNKLILWNRCVPRFPPTLSFFYDEFNLVETVALDRPF